MEVESLPVVLSRSNAALRLLLLLRSAQSGEGENMVERVKGLNNETCKQNSLERRHLQVIEVLQRLKEEIHADHKDRVRQSIREFRANILRVLLFFSGLFAAGVVYVAECDEH